MKLLALSGLALIAALTFLSCKEEKKAAPKTVKIVERYDSPKEIATAVQTNYAKIMKAARTPKTLEEAKDSVVVIEEGADVLLALSDQLKKMPRPSKEEKMKLENFMNEKMEEEMAAIETPTEEELGEDAESILELIESTMSQFDERIAPASAIFEKYFQAEVAPEPPVPGDIPLEEAIVPAPAPIPPAPIAPDPVEAPTPPDEVPE